MSAFYSRHRLLDVRTRQSLRWAASLPLLGVLIILLMMPVRRLLIPHPDVPYKPFLLALGFNLGVFVLIAAGLAALAYVVWPVLREILELAPVNAAQVGAWHDARWKGGGAYFLLTASSVAVGMFINLAPSPLTLTGTPLGLALTLLPSVLLWFLSLASGVLLRILNDDAHVEAEHDHA